MNTTTAVAEKRDEFYDFAKGIERKEGDKVKDNKSAPKTVSFPYKGRKNQTDFPEFVNICKLSEKKLKQFLCRKMKDIYGEENTIIGDGYIYCRGDIPVLLTAHMDTVHAKLVKDFYEDIQTDENGNITHVISSPQGIGGDDRCGIYAILKVIEAGYYPYILFCEEEETGGIGSKKFCKTKYITELSELKFLLELDRANANDLVFYDNDNQDWIDWIEDETNWKKSWGTFSDISHLSPACEISSVNLSCGYYKAHTVYEYVKVEEMLEMIEMVKHLLEASEKVKEPFIYKEAVHSWNRYGYGYNWDGYDYYGYRKNANKNSTNKKYDEVDLDDYDDYDSYYYRKVNEESSRKYQLEVYFVNEEDKEDCAVITGKSEADCWMNFFFDYYEICFEKVLDYDFYVLTI